MTLVKNYLLQLWTAIGSYATAPTGQPAFAHWTLRKEGHVVPGLGVSIARLLQEHDDRPRLPKVQHTVCNPLVIGSDCM